MCVFLISPVPIAEPLTSELIDTPVFYNLAPRPIKYRVSVPIPTPHTITPPPAAWTIETRRDGSMLSCSLRQILTHLNVAAEIQTHQTRQRFSIFYCAVLLSLCELYPPCPVLIWQERHPVWSSAAGAHLLQGSMCCVFRDGILQILVVTSGYLSYCCLSIISNQSVHSPLTSDINKAFSSTQLPLTGYFLFFRPFSVNPRDGCVWKSQ